MNKLVFIFFLVLSFIINFSIQAQYKLKVAFPNLAPFSFPVELTNAHDSTNRLFVVEQHGKIYSFQNSPTVSTKKLFLDLSQRVDQSTITGLFGLAFHPDYKNNRYIYVHYVFDSLGGPINKWIKVSRFETSPTNPDSVLPSTEVNLITISLMRKEHNGGKVAFGPDGYLYFSTGDASIGGDSSRNLKSLLGKVVRINVDSAANGKNYSIPPSNPFFENQNGYAQEIYAYGFRNPWKFCIDHPTNRIFLGDVGSSKYEEIDLVQSGKDYGWIKMEGFHCFPYTSPCDTAGYGLTRPIWEYSFAPSPIGEAVTGGYVYRGSLLPDLYGKYIYGDYINASIWALNYNGSAVTSNTLLFDSSFFLVSFGVDEANELYALSYAEGTFDGVGTILRLYNPAVLTLNVKMIVEGLYNEVQDRLNIRDTVTAYLYTITHPLLVSDSSKAVVDSTNFNGVFTFKNAPTGTYFIKVKYRNGLETWSKEGGLLLTRGSVSAYDFTNEITKAMGSNLKLKGNRYCIYSGDCNADGFINALDRAAVVSKWSQTGRQISDLDGNQLIDAADRTIVVGNLGKSKVTP